jgi:hypothetical protein
MTNENLPAFAKQWMQQWASAGPALERVRAQELRAMTTTDLARSVAFIPNALERANLSNYSGLIDQQAWFMRQRVQFLLEGRKIR